MMKRFAVLFLPAICVALTGCSGGLFRSRASQPASQPAAAWPSPAAAAVPLPGEAAPADPNKPGAYFLVVRIRMVTVEVPVGMASGSEEIWSYLDEEPVRTVRSVNLGRNGLRVGVGRQDAWGDLVRILRRMTGRTPKQNLMICIPGSPLPIVLKEGQDVQTVFTFHDDRTLVGADYPPGDNVLSMVCTLDEDDLSKVLITASPQVCSSRRRTRFVLGDAGPKVVTEPEIFGFDQLTFQLRIRSKDLLVIGPGAQSRRPTSVGHHFLVKKRDGMEFETMLVLMPEVYAAPARTTPAVPGGQPSG